MIREWGYSTYEEAKERAEALLWENRPKGTDTQDTTAIRRLDKDGNYIGMAYIQDNATGATACLYSLPSLENEEIQHIVYLSPEEADPKNRTFVFRTAKVDSLPFLLALRVAFFRPTEVIPLDEAFTPEAVAKVNAFFGEDTSGDLLTKEQLEEGAFTMENAFTYFLDDNDKVDTIQVECKPFPSVLEEATGKKIKTAKDYAKALAYYLKADLDKEHLKEIEGTYNFYCSYALLRYATYEFFRTEDYNHLEEILGQYKAFGLPKDWNKEQNAFQPFDCTPETYAVGKYLAQGGAEMLQCKSNLREIAQYTHTPLKVALQAAKSRYYWN